MALKARRVFTPSGGEVVQGEGAGVQYACSIGGPSILDSLTHQHLYSLGTL